MVWERKTACHIDPYFFLLIISHRVINKALLSTSTFRHGGVLNQKPTLDCSLLSLRPYIFSSNVTYSAGPRLESAWPPAVTVLYLPTRLTTVSWHWQTPTHPDGQPISHAGICIYHFVTSTHFRSTIWLLPLIFIGASSVENLWLTVRSKVSMQHNQDYIIWFSNKSRKDTVPNCQIPHRQDVLFFSGDVELNGLHELILYSN